MVQLKVYVLVTGQKSRINFCEWYYNKHVGIVVDTHVIRISNLLNLTTSKNPISIENDLISLFPKKDWGLLSHLLIAHGRKICSAKKPKCFECQINKYCYYFNSLPT